LSLVLHLSTTHNYCRWIRKKLTIHSIHLACTPTYRVDLPVVPNTTSSGRPLPAPWQTYEHAQQGPLTGLSLAPGGADALATASVDGTVCVWGAAVSEPLGRWCAELLQC